MTTEDKLIGNGWNEYSRLVISELKRLSSWCKIIDEKLAQSNIEIAKLKVKAGFWGLLGGAIPVIIGIGVYLLTRGGI